MKTSKATRLSAMPKNDYLPDIPAGWYQLDPVAILVAGDQIWSRYTGTWLVIATGSINIGTSAGNTRISIRKS